MSEYLKRVLSQKEVAERIGTSSSTVGRLVKAGKFSPPFSVTCGRVGWFIEDVDAWLDERKRATEDERAAAKAEIEAA